MSKPKLSYFDFPGRGFPARVCLFNGLGKEGWEDDRVADFGALKPSLPLGQLPVLTLGDGRVITQSNAIACWAAKQGDEPLWPADAESQMIIDEVAGILSDGLSKCPQDADEEVKKTKRQEYAAGFLTTAMNLVDKRVQGPFLLGEKLSVGDLGLYSFVDMIMTGMFDHVPASFVDA